jgi:hypothetical protein
LVALTDFGPVVVQVMAIEVLLDVPLPPPVVHVQPLGFGLQFWADAVKVTA